jgi:threonine/homoserine/homoserine lactone efflux protein
MMTLQTFANWLALMSPLIFSPGPANLSVANLVARGGIKGSLPFILGITTVNIALLLLIGMLIGQLQDTLPQVFDVISLIGALYVCYLASLFIRQAPKTTSSEANKQEHLGFKQGLLLQLLNGKYYPTAITMFTIFINHDQIAWIQVLMLSAMLTGLALISYMIWGMLGSAIKTYLNGQIAFFIQKYLFGGILFLIGIKLLLNNNLWY